MLKNIQTQDYTMKILAEDNEEVLVLCDVKRQTDDAILVLGDEGDDIWLPMSQVEIVDIISDLEYEMSIPIWLAQEKEII